MAETNMSWYVLRAISGKESKVKEYIDAEIKNGHYDGNVSQVLIPTEKKYVLSGSKRVLKEFNYLPGYVLVEARLVGEVAHRLRFTPQVLGFLGGQEHPTPLRENEVNRILGKVDDLLDAPDQLSISFTVGEAVKVTDGPFAGFSGLVKEVDDEKHKVTVMVKVFGRETPLDLGYMQLERE